jgi:Rieske Fe-S protein
LGRGEGGIVRCAGEKVAAYRDVDGTLCAVSPVCTHLGCLVAFNTAEKTWDCPCHGSRFTVSGEVLQGPATDDLEQKPTS